MFRIETWACWGILTLSVSLASFAQAQTPPGVDHYVCHGATDAKLPAQAKFPKEAPASQVIAIPFEDAFSSLVGGVPLYDMSGYAKLCVPSRKIHAGSDFPIAFPDVHLVELQAKLASKLPSGAKIEPKQPKIPKGTIVRVIDQFHDQRVELKKPVSVLVRASKVDFGPPLKCKTDAECNVPQAPPGSRCQPSDKPKTCFPSEPSVAPAPANDVGVDNYTCYQVKPVADVPSFPAVEFENQFTEALADGTLRYDLKAISKLCAPADKLGENPGAEGHVGYLACYQAKLAKKDASGAKLDPKPPKFGVRKVSIDTVNFGARFLDVKAEKEICVPAFRDQIAATPTPVPSASPSPTPTLSPTPSPTPSRTPTPVPSASASPSPTPSRTPTPVPSASASPSPTPSRTPTPVPSASASPSPTPSRTPTPVPSASPSPTPSRTPTPVPTASPSPTPSRTPTPVPTASPSPSPSPGLTCTTVSITANVSYNTSDFPDVSGMQTDISYPVTVSIPGTANQSSVLARVTKLNPVNGSFLVSDNDAVPATAAISVGLVSIPGPIPPGNFARVKFDCVTGVTPNINQFNCTPSGSTNSGGPLTATCALSLSVP